MMRICGRQWTIRRWTFELEQIFEPRDIWIGIRWKKYPRALEIYVCVLPIFPIRLYVQNQS